MSSSDPGSDPAARPTADVSVRPARAADSTFVAQVQVETWQACYSVHLPAGALDAVSVPLVEAGWRAAVTSPPSPAHRLLVATSTGRLIGYVALGPAEDEDAAPQDAEVYALTVSPPEQRLGHGSRLLAAAVEVLEQSGFQLARIWTFDGDAPVHRFLRAAGWAPDGAKRMLDMGADVGQQRWHSLLRDP